MQEFAERLDGGHHAGQYVIPAEQPANFGLEARPGARAKLAQELPIETGVQPQGTGLGTRADPTPRKAIVSER
jgi:hypothetical protein